MKCAAPCALLWFVLLACGDDDDASGLTGEGASAQGADAGAAGDDLGGGAGAAGDVCPVDQPTDQPPPDLPGSGFSGPTSEMTPQDKEDYCDWLWDLPGYGEEYCCEGVLHPLRAAVFEEGSRETCVAQLDDFDDCENFEIGLFEDCALGKLGRVCGTPPGCFAFGHGALSTTCLGN